MNHLKQFFLELVEQIKAVVRLPWMLLDFFQGRKQQAEADAQERERLDRIRNPSKYLGK